VKKRRLVPTLVTLAFVAVLVTPSVAHASAAEYQAKSWAAKSTHKRVHRWGPLWVDAPPKALPPLPFSVDPEAALVVGGCLVVLMYWVAWQNRNRCDDCGYAPMFCRCEKVVRR
jgi:hypothetical protein